MFCALQCVPVVPNILNTLGSKCRLVNDCIFKCNLLAFCFASRGQRYVLNLLSDLDCGMRSSGLAAYFSGFTNPLFVCVCMRWTGTYGTHFCILFFFCSSMYDSFVLCVPK